MTGAHHRAEYACGHVQSQCRCPGPKTVTRLPGVCPSCRARGQLHDYDPEAGLSPLPLREDRLDPDQDGDVTVYPAVPRPTR